MTTRYRITQAGVDRLGDDYDGYSAYYDVLDALMRSAGGATANELWREYWLEWSGPQNMQQVLDALVAIGVAVAVSTDSLVGRQNWPSWSDKDAR